RRAGAGGAARVRSLSHRGRHGSGEGADAQEPRASREHGAARARRGDPPGRLRHRLLVARAPGAAAGGRGQDRPLLRGARRRRPGDPALHRHPDPRPRPAGHRRGGGDRGGPAARARGGLPLRAGLLLLPPHRRLRARLAARGCAALV
ncbi:MAG: diguanylate cyclase/phosphodiesterase (GGDEF & EAL domains) with PAS/PAC sensor(s), partial [uncultured Gemmatimonadetes bacterium]